MKQKKVAKKKKPVKRKIDVVLASLLNIEQRMKELIKKVERLENIQPTYNNNKYPEPKYWPNIPRYDTVTWNDGCQNKVK